MGIYNVPVEFSDALENEFKGKLRVRWSDQYHEWHIEQKTRRTLGTFPFKADRYSDDVIRYKDGYVWIMSVKQGSKFSCPNCHMDLTAPTRATEMISCLYCRLKGYNHHHYACHWPLDWTLIDHLKKLERQIDDNGKRLKDQDAALQKTLMRQALDPTLDRFLEDHQQIAGIQQVGYTGKEFTDRCTSENGIGDKSGWPNVRA